MNAQIDHELKLAILKLLNAEPGHRIAANQMARTIGTTQATISRHLTELLELQEIRFCVMNQRKYYFVPTDAELAAQDASPALPNWRTAKDYKYPLQIQRRIKEIAEHRERFRCLFRELISNPVDIKNRSLRFLHQVLE